MSDRSGPGGRRSPVPEETQLEMYISMLRIRRVEEVIASLYAEQEMRCPVHFAIGQEAPPVGVSEHLEPDDLVFSAHRSHGHYLAKGGSLKAMVAELYGKVTGCARGKGGSQHLIDLDCGFMGSAPILASTISVAVGAAWAGKMDGKNSVVVAYFGDGATEEGTFHEALNFAGVKQLPILFVCEHNLYSVHSALDVRQPDRPITALAEAHGLMGLHGDGNDADEIYGLASTAVERARNGKGASILELKTYRWLEHCGPNEDVNLGYRSAEEVELWRARCPLVSYRERLLEAGILTAERDAAENRKIEQEIEQAVTFAKNSAFPGPEELTMHVHPGARRQV